LGATYTDNSGNIWSGMPLMYPCGVVDDTTNVHGAGAFNDALAAAGYDVKVTGASGDNYTCRSTVVANNQYLILANTVKMVSTENFTPLTGNQYPLKLVGPGLTPDQMVEGVSEVQLLNFPPFIQASAGVGGSISPSGDMVLSSGADQPFVIAANAGYHISDVKVDGSSIGAVSNYTLAHVTSYHTIAASFLGDTCPITATAGAGGTISPSGTIAVNYGNSQSFTITPDGIHRILNVTVDGSTVGAVSSYTFTNVTAAHAITASFVPAWDLNGDHNCNIGDVVKVGLKWGQTGSPGWIPEDVSPNGAIDIGDVVVIGLYWGQTG
jgi:hypothetical protein